MTNSTKVIQKRKKFVWFLRIFFRYGTGAVAEAVAGATTAAQKNRAERFGIPIKSSTTASDVILGLFLWCFLYSYENLSFFQVEEKKKTRAERFGISAVAAPTTNPNGSVKSAAAAAEVPSEEQTEMLKKRAQRFGLSQTETIQNLGSQERLAMRKQKFVGIPSTPEIEAKKAKRAERFGV